jgi:hypothetical protein
MISYNYNNQSIELPNTRRTGQTGINQTMYFYIKKKMNLRLI